MTPIAITMMVIAILTVWGGLAVALECADQRAYVLGDRGRLVQLLENLLSSAEKFAHSPDTVHIAIRQEEGAAEDLLQARHLAGA